MKKLFFFLVATVLLAVNVNVNAQEVHGVESKMVCTYDCNPNGSWDSWYDYRTEKIPWFAYEFTNLNSIPVSVEVELYHEEKISDYKAAEFRVIATKSFVLQSGESYVFKTEEKGICTYSISFNNYYSKHSSYYIKYKAYKLL